MVSDTWNLLKTDFDEKLPRRTAIFVKEDDWSLPFAYPCEFGSIGWNLDYREQTTYDESPSVTIRFGEYSYPDLTQKHMAKNTFFFNYMEYLPGLVRRKVSFSNIGLEALERFAQCPDGGWTWQFDLSSWNLAHHIFHKKLYAVVTFNHQQPQVKMLEGHSVLACCFGEKSLYLAAGCTAFGCYRTVDDYLEAMESGNIANAQAQGKYLVLEFDLTFNGYQEKCVLPLGLSFQSAEKAAAAMQVQDIENKLQTLWNNWFNSLPELPEANEREKTAYYKCWWVIRSNYYLHPRWGKSVLEAFPVYRGFWQWALPAAEWHSSLNPEIGPAYSKRLLDLFLKYQREDGYVTHAIYLDEEQPGSSWGRSSIIQTPHIPWVAMRYYNATKDIDSLRNWYPRLVKYYEYLNESRDRQFFNLHLWGIITSFDTGLDTTAVFQKVTYGEDGVREKFCYPAIFAAERCRFEQALAKMAQVLGTGEEAKWQNEAEATRQAMDKCLWDEKKHWYGVIHEDKTLDTRVGVDGLFPFAYGVVTKDKAEAARENFEKLIGPFGICTVAPGEKGYYASTYWRGPVWPKSCSMGMAAAYRYYPDLLPKVKDGLVNFLLRFPSVWECMNAWTGEIAHSDMGFMATPVVSSNVGAGEAMGTLRLCFGDDMLAF